MSLKLSDFNDPEFEYQRVCALINRYAQLHEHTSAKNMRLRQRVAELEKERSDLMQSIHDQADRYDELQQELELSDALQRDKVATLTAERDKATRYWQIAEGRCDALKQQRDELLAAAEAIEIDAEECLDFDDCTAMFVSIDAYHKLMEAIASINEK